MDALQETARSLRDELSSTRADMAAILRDDNYDKAKVETLFRKQDEIFAQMRTAAAASVEKIHGVLDDKQKQDLAEMVERGFRRFSYGHAYGRGC
jgi:Spy/CpxP family protein refolding chaperone